MRPLAKHKLYAYRHNYRFIDSIVAEIITEGDVYYGTDASGANAARMLSDFRFTEKSVDECQHCLDAANHSQGSNITVWKSISVTTSMGATPNWIPAFPRLGFTATGSAPPGGASASSFAFQVVVDTLYL